VKFFIDIMNDLHRYGIAYLCNYWYSGIGYS